MDLSVYNDHRDGGAMVRRPPDCSVQTVCLFNSRYFNSSSYSQNLSFSLYSVSTLGFVMTGLSTEA